MKKIKKSLAIFTMGLLLGLVSMNLVNMRTIDNLYESQSQLNNQLLDKEIKLKNLTASLESEKTRIVKSLIINVDLEGNSSIEEEIRQEVYLLLKDYIGQELWRIEGEIIYKILEGRIFQIGAKEIKLRIKYLIIQEEITLEIIASLLQKH